MLYTHNNTIYCGCQYLPIQGKVSPEEPLTQIEKQCADTQEQSDIEVRKQRVEQNTPLDDPEHLDTPFQDCTQFRNFVILETKPTINIINRDLSVTLGDKICKPLQHILAWHFTPRSFS